MRYVTLALVLSSSLACAGAPAAPPAPAAEDTPDPQQIIALEQGALDRWAQGDPDGYFAIMAEDITYFDPTTQTRIDGLPALKKMIEPFRGKFRIDRVELVNPQVRIDGDIATLTANLISRGAQGPDGGPKRDVPWNTTEVYRRMNGRWLIVHSHFSYTQPKLAAPGGP
jgi:uncharacterized protein (TIGR02246 family)